MKASLKETLKKIRKEVKEHYIMLMEISTLESLKTIRGMEKVTFIKIFKEYYTMLMEIYMKEIGRKI